MYYIPRMGKHGYELAKFEDRSFPIEVYHTYDKRCDCPSFKRPCKHISIMKAWERDNRTPGNVYTINEKVELVGNLL